MRKKYNIEYLPERWYHEVHQNCKDIYLEDKYSFLTKNRGINLYINYDMLKDDNRNINAWIVKYTLLLTNNDKIINIHIYSNFIENAKKSVLSF